MHPFIQPLAAILLTAGAALLFVSAGAAQQLDAPQGDVILTVSGNIEAAGDNGVVRFDLDGLRDLGGREFVTSTIWTQGRRRFRGVSLDVLLDHLRARGRTLRAVAINDYVVKIPVTDATPAGPIIAYEMDGEAMSLRDKGPLWVVYPYDSAAEYRSEVIFARSIWQLDRIEVID